MKISAIIITKDPELNYLLLQSLSFADEVVIIADSPFRKYERPNEKCKIFFHPLNDDFSAQRNFGIEKAKGDWLLFVDSDEYVGTELSREIQTAIRGDQYSGFYIGRRDLVFHQPLLHGETGHQKLLRLAKKDSGIFMRQVHEFWRIRGRVGELRSPLYHIKDHFVSEFISRLDRYGQIDSQILVTEGKPFSWFRLIFFPIAKFKLNYLFRAGFLDGTAGLFLAYLLSVQSLSTRVFQWENKK